MFHHEHTIKLKVLSLDKSLLREIKYTVKILVKSIVLNRERTGVIITGFYPIEIKL